MKQRIAAIIAEDGGNLNDYIVGLLAAELGVEYESFSRKARRMGDTEQITLQMPLELKRRLDYAALDAGTNRTDEIGRRLAKHLGMEWAPLSSRSVPFGGGRRGAGAAA